MDPETDSELIVRSLNEPRAFEAVFARHFDAVRRYAQRRVGLADGEEIAAMTFERAFAQRGRFRASVFTSARPWLIGIANNLIRSHIRHLAVQRRHSPLSIALPLLSPEPDLDAIEALERWPALRIALQGMKSHDRETFLLLVLGDLSYEEVAQILRVPTGTVRSRVNRARGQLRELIGADEAIPPGEREMEDPIG